MLKPYFLMTALFLLAMATKNVRGWTPILNRAISRRAQITANRHNSIYQPHVRHFQSSSPLSSSTLYDEFRNLVLEIQKHDNLYYNSQPVLKDEEYDALVQQEAKLGTNHPEFVTKLQQTEGIITRYAGGRVGYQPVSGEKVPHLVPMLSLDNIHSEGELVEWLRRIQRKLGDGVEELELTTEPKLDGLSLSLRYGAKGQLLWAATRGDGVKGQNVTLAIQDMGASSSIPRQIDPTKIPNNKRGFEVRGEIILPLTIFEKLRHQKQEECDNNSTAASGRKERSAELHFSNARNAASGILLRKANNQTIRQDLKFFAYDMVLIVDSGIEDEELLSASQSDINIRSTLLSLGFQIPEPHLISKVQLLPETEENKTAAGKILGLEPILDYIHQYFQYKQQQQNSDYKAPPIFDDNNLFGGTDFDMDGAVHKVSSTSTRSILGSSKRSPRWAIAHKIQPQTFVTKLLGIDIQVGRTGALTPVAQLEPIEIAGVTVQRATLHNFGHLQQLMGDNVKEVPIGTPVLVRRAGEVIPQVVQRVVMTNMTNSDSGFISLKPPTHCPVCNSKTIWEESQESSSASVATKTSLICGGPPLQCSSRAVAMLQHAFSRDAMDIKGLSESRIKQLRDEEILQVPADLFTLMNPSPSENTHDVSHNETSRVDQLENLEGWGPKSVQNLQAECHRVMTQGLPLERFIYSLGIKQTGKHTSELLASLYGGQVELFLNDLEVASSPQNDNAFEVLKKESEDTKGIGPVLIDSLYAYSRDSQLLQAAKKLSSLVPVIPSLSINKSSQKDDNHTKPWKGWSVVFTGSILNLTRGTAEALAIELLGAKSTPKSVTKKTTLIVVGDSKGGVGKKLSKAEELGIATMRADVFLTLVHEREKEKKPEE
mmetsp:Transcript_23156/g.35119  ORF Transcript_23156/g.35119 Transcript_23156/m.35119 type:complete len:884 (-) Transcript_23156:111-2762(-)